MTVDNLSAAIITAVTDEKQISRAKLAGEAIRKVCYYLSFSFFFLLLIILFIPQEDGVGNAIQCIYRDLDYARSLIPPVQVPKIPRSDSNNVISQTSTLLPATIPLPLSKSTSITGFHPARSSSKAGSSEGDWDILSESGASRSRIGSTTSNRLSGNWEESLSRGSSRARSGVRSASTSSRGGDNEMSDSSEGELVGTSSMEGSRNLSSV